MDNVVSVMTKLEKWCMTSTMGGDFFSCHFVHL